MEGLDKKQREGTIDGRRGEKCWKHRAISCAIERQEEKQTHHDETEAHDSVPAQEEDASLVISRGQRAWRTNLGFE